MMERLLLNCSMVVPIKNGGYSHVKLYHAITARTVGKLDTLGFKGRTLIE
jgi:hypothetical protein